MGEKNLIKRHRLSDGLKKKHTLTICFPQKTHIKSKHKNNQSKNRGGKIDYRNRNHKKYRMPILISWKIDLKNVTRGIEGIFITKGTIHQENIIIINIHATNNRVQKLTELKGKIENPIIIVGDFNTPISITDRTTRKRSTRKQKS